MSCSTPRSFRHVAVRENRSLAPGIFELRAPWEGAPPLPGQFFMLKPARSGVFLGRAISVADFREGVASFLIALRGAGTRELAELRPGDDLFLQGPLGEPWPLPPPASGEGKRPALIGGGVGVAPVAFLARRLPPGSYDFYAGFRDAPYGLEGLEPARLLLASESGAEGAHRGLALDRFDPAAASGLWACGPEPLLRAVAGLAREAGLPAWLSLERRMACGAGACLGCTVRTARGNRRCCADGPVFEAQEVLFDE